MREEVSEGRCVSGSGVGKERRKREGRGDSCITFRALIGVDSPYEDTFGGSMGEVGDDAKDVQIYRHLVRNQRRRSRCGWRDSTRRLAFSVAKKESSPSADEKMVIQLQCRPAHCYCTVVVLPQAA